MGNNKSSVTSRQQEMSGWVDDGREMFAYSCGEKRRRWPRVADDHRHQACNLGTSTTVKAILIDTSNGVLFSSSVSH